MREIPLSQGKVALVDDSDYEWLSQWKWYADVRSHTCYAKRNAIINGKRRPVKMHREILGLSLSDPGVDHRDHNGLNNQRSNLRLASQSENMANMKVLGTSKGICIDKRRKGKPWRAQITVRGVNRHLGTFESAEKAIKAYDKASKEYFGEFANTNIK